MEDLFGEFLAKRWLTVALLGISPTVSTLAAESPPTPNSGTILQQTQPKPVPAPSSSDSSLQIEEPVSATALQSEPFLISRIEISGNSRIDTATLHAMVAGAEGRRLTLAQLATFIRRLTDYYRAKGYVLARAIIPAQTLHQGVVRVEIIEARYDRITLNNQSRVDSRLLDETLAHLRSGEVVSQEPLDHSLLLLSDIPGMTLSATLKPGAAVGSSDLQVDTTAAPAIRGSVTADNYDDRYSGRGRLGATANLLDPLGHGDQVTLNALTSASSGLNYGRLSYDTLLDGEGTRFGAGYSGLHYRLGGALSALDASGSAQDGMLWARSVVLRSRTSNVYVQMQYDHLQLNDDIGASDMENRRHLDSLTTTFSGNLRDDSLAGGSTTWSAGWTCGVVSFDNAAAATADAASANTQGGFLRWNLSLGRLQSFDAYDAFYLGVAGQYANGNLDSSQKMVVGGPDSVRAYDVSALSGDTGFQITAELRHTFAQQRHGMWQAVVFVDDARVSVDGRPFAPGRNLANLSGAGLGLNWAGPGQWTAGVMVATPIGERPQLAGDTANTHLWAQVTKGF
jgi:hemolysin activation/secretion protein